MGLLQPEERWGPPDSEERILRYRFNPREEIRSRRRNDACKHKCLLSSRVSDLLCLKQEKNPNWTPGLDNGFGAQS